MSYDGGLAQAELESKSENIASRTLNCLNEASLYFEKVLSWADGRTDAQLAAWIIATDNQLDTKRFPDAASVEVFVADLRALAVAINAINTGVSAGDRADIVKFA